MNNNLNKKEIELLCNAILEIKTMEECKNFLDDLCSIQEINSMAQRILVAKMLKAKNVYTTIANQTGASTATISRVNKCLNYGANGYALILDRLANHEKSIGTLDN